jgi:hypothetical protein
MQHEADTLPTLSVDLVAAAQRSRGPLAHLAESTLRALEQRYRMYLLLRSRNFDQIFAPTESIDEMWHLHMLHPCAYANDCYAIFGKILDHNPGFGHAAGELPILIAHFESTRALWEAEFGTPYVEDEGIGATQYAGRLPRGVIMCADEEGRPKPKPEPAPKPKPKPSRTSVSPAH